MILHANRGFDPMAFLDDLFKFRRVSSPRPDSLGDTRSSLVAMLGADFQVVVAPFKTQILERARHLGGDHHRAAMALLADRAGRRHAGVEQQLIIAALAELQGVGAAAGPLERIAARLTAASNESGQTGALQVHQAFDG
jgi:hypothetical protein